MKIESREIIATVLLLSILSVVAIPYLTSKSKGSEEVLKYSGTVCIFLNDNLVDCRSNLLTNVGKNMIRGSLQGLVSNVNKIALATNTQAMSPTDTVLQGEITDCGLGAATGTITNSSTAGQWNISYQWTSTCDNKIVNATGLYNATGINTLFAETTFATVILNTNDKINVTWTLSITE